MAATVADRIARGVRMRARIARHRGDAVWCPICDRGFDRFADELAPEAGLCWRCGGRPRHRAQWMLVSGRPQLLQGAGSLLHFAPEWALRHRFAARPGLRYVTADLMLADVDLRLDITGMDAVGDGEFDAVICSHVLEHVPDDAAAMAELRRVTAADGWCLVMTPLDLERPTYEDWSIVEPADRLRAFAQVDHVRIYGPDIADRLHGAGFAVERIDPRSEFGAERCARCAIPDHEVFWLCRPR